MTTLTSFFGLERVGGGGGGGGRGEWLPLIIQYLYTSAVLKFLDSIERSAKIYNNGLNSQSNVVTRETTKC